MPAARASTGLWKWTGRPSSSICPPDGGKLPAMLLTSVDLPAPLSPISPTISPQSSAKSTCDKASMAPKCLEIPWSSRTATDPPFAPHLHSRQIVSRGYLLVVKTLSVRLRSCPAAIPHVFRTARLQSSFPPQRSWGGVGVLRRRRGHALLQTPPMTPPSASRTPPQASLGEEISRPSPSCPCDATAAQHRPAAAPAVRPRRQPTACGATAPHR